MRMRGLHGLDHGGWRGVRWWWWMLSGRGNLSSILLPVYRNPMGYQNGRSLVVSCET
jgi:hypothetical protein